MARVTGPLLALLFAAVMNAPSLYLLQFTVHKAYVERELCVQRDVMEDMRTCHGECQLTKKFRALEEESNSRFPADRLEIRFTRSLIVRTRRWSSLPARSRSALEFPDMCRIQSPPATRCPRAWCLGVEFHRSAFALPGWWECMVEPSTTIHEIRILAVWLAVLLPSISIGCDVCGIFLGIQPHDGTSSFSCSGATVVSKAPCPVRLLRVRPSTVVMTKARSHQEKRTIVNSTK